MIPVDRRPHPVGPAVAVVVGAVGLSLIAGAWTQTRPIGVELAGLAALLLGVELYRRESPVVGVALAVAGVAGALGGIGLGYAMPTTSAARLELLPGMLGLLVLLLGAVRIRKRLARPLLLAGAGLLFLSVLVSGVVRGAELFQLLGTTVCTVVAWDVAEHGLSLAEQVGRRARTIKNRAINGTSSLAVGGAGVGLAWLLLEIGPNSMSLSGFLLLLAAAVVLALALYD